MLHKSTYNSDLHTFSLTSSEIMLNWRPMALYSSVWWSHAARIVRVVSFATPPFGQACYQSEQHSSGSKQHPDVELRGTTQIRTATTNPPRTMYAKEGSVTCTVVGEFVSV